MLYLMSVLFPLSVVADEDLQATLACERASFVCLLPDLRACRTKHWKIAGMLSKFMSQKPASRQKQYQISIQRIHSPKITCTGTYSNNTV